MQVAQEGDGVRRLGGSFLFCMQAWTPCPQTMLQRRPAGLALPLSTHSWNRRSAGSTRRCPTISCTHASTTHAACSPAHVQRQAHSSVFGKALIAAAHQMSKCAGVCQRLVQKKRVQVCWQQLSRMHARMGALVRACERIWWVPASMHAAQLSPTHILQFTVYTALVQD